MNPGAINEHRCEFFDNGRGYGRARGDNPFQRRQYNVPIIAVFTHSIQQRRRGKHAGNPLVLDGLDNFFRVCHGRFGRIHIRNDGGNSQRRPKQRKKRKGGKIDFFTGQPQMGFYMTQLCIEVSVSIYGTLGRTRAAGGE